MRDTGNTFIIPVTITSFIIIIIIIVFIHHYGDGSEGNSYNLIDKDNNALYFLL